jgi:hypothetical protein
MIFERTSAAPGRRTLIALSRTGAVHAIARAVLFTLAATALLGSYSGTLAAAQTVQNSTTAFEYDAVGNRTRICCVPRFRRIFSRFSVVRFWPGRAYFSAFAS